MDNLIKENDFILVCTANRKYFTQVKKGGNIHTKNGILHFDDIIGKEYGSRIKQHSIFKPTLDDIILYGLKRQTQVVYGKDAVHIVDKLNLKNGDKVFECGTGNGALSLYIKRAIAPDGMLFTYEKEEKFFLNAVENIKKFDSMENIKMFNKNIDEGIEEKDFDAAFLDLKEPDKYIEFVCEILKKGGVLGIIVPTTNQVCDVLKKMERKFYDIEVKEIIVRDFKPNPHRLRPKDIMVGHTGYLIFGR